MYRAKILPLIALALLAGCKATTGGYSFLHTEYADKTYTRLPMHMSNRTRPVVYLKTFEQEGNIGLCGYYTNVTGLNRIVFCSWLQQAAHVELKGQNVSSAGFIIVSDEENGRYSGLAACVVTEVPYSVDLAYSRPRVTGYRARVTEGDC